MNNLGVLKKKKWYMSRIHLIFLSPVLNLSLNSQMRYFFFELREILLQLYLTKQLPICIFFLSKPLAIWMVKIIGF